MGRLISLPRAQNQNVAVLEALLEYERQFGNMHSLMVVARFHDEDPHIGISGRYLTNLDAAIADLRMAKRELIWKNSFKYQESM